jgi:polar amino acid transport system substrate-binding protein
MEPARIHTIKPNEQGGLIMRKALALLTATFAVVVLGAQSPASAETLRVGMECTYAPFNFKNADGELDGYDVDVAKGVAGLIGADLEFVCQKWDGMIPALLANKFDLVVASMSITDKRLEKMDFSDTYRISVGRLVGKKDAGLNLFDDAGKPIPANFAGLKVGLERATTYSDWFENELPEADVVLYDTNEALYLDLVNGRTDMIMTNPMKAHLRFLSKEDGAGFEFVSPQIDEKKYFGIGVGIGLRKGNDALKARLNGALKTLTDDGSLERYALKYFPFAIHK